MGLSKLVKKVTQPFQKIANEIGDLIPNEIAKPASQLIKATTATAGFGVGGTTGAALATGNIDSAKDATKYLALDTAGLAAGYGIAASGLVAGGAGAAGAGAGAIAASSIVPSSAVAAAGAAATKYAPGLLDNFFSPREEVIEAPAFRSPVSMQGASAQTFIVLAIIAILGFILFRKGL